MVVVVVNAVVGENLIELPCDSGSRRASQLYTPIPRPAAEHVQL